MFYVNNEEELNTVLLSKMIHKYNLENLPKLRKYKNYYDGIQAILNKSYVDASKPCNHSVINYCKNIADSYCGYLATPGYISYRSDNDIEDIMNILRYNDYQAEDAELLQDALVYGVAAELMYFDSLGQTRFKLISPTSCFGIYDDSLTGDLLYFVRFYEASQWDNSDLYYVDVYSDSTIKHYQTHGLNGNLEFLEEMPHYFGQVPANILVMPDEKSIFDCILTLQDSVNELVSAEIDDYSAFCDAYLALVGVDAEVEDIAAMKENRVIILPEGASASWITKSASDAQVENILKRLHESIYRVAQCPDFSSESFIGGVSSGIAIQYRLTGMETKAGKIEAIMKKALQRRVEIICSIASLKLGEDVFRDIDISFKRNIPADTNATIQLINSLKGTVSDATLLGQLDFITDVNAELEAVKAQKEENMSLFAFGASTEDGADDE